MGTSCLVVDALYFLHTTKNYFDHILWGVYEEDLQLCLKCPDNKYNGLCKKWWT